MLMQGSSTLSASGHLSAKDATAMTHSLRMEWGHTHNPSFRTTNEKYGQRLPLEQASSQTLLRTNPVAYNAATAMTHYMRMECSHIHIPSFRTINEKLGPLRTWPNAKTNITQPSVLWQNAGLSVVCHILLPNECFLVA